MLTIMMKQTYSPFFFAKKTQLKKNMAGEFFIPSPWVQPTFWGGHLQNGSRSWPFRGGGWPAESVTRRIRWIDRGDSGWDSFCGARFQVRKKTSLTHDGSMYVCYDHGNIHHQYTPVMLAYIPYIRILWVSIVLNDFSMLVKDAFENLWTGSLWRFHSIHFWRNPEEDRQVQSNSELLW